LAGCAVSRQQKKAQRLKAGQEHMARKDFARAIQDFESAAQTMPRDAEPQYQVGLAYLAVRNLKRSTNRLPQSYRIESAALASQLEAYRDPDRDPQRHAPR
jgi:Flp pilus assembly protein TadD